MTARARDAVPLTAGAYLIALGAVFLVDSTGVHSIDAGGLIGAAVGLALIALGVLALLAWLRVRHVARRLHRAIGDVRSVSGWAVDDGVISTVLGDIALDFRDAELPAGETDLTLLCWLGTIQVRIPRDVGVDVTAQTMVGSLDVLGRREQGLVRDIHLRSDAFEQSDRRLRLRLSTFVGELLVQHR